MHKFQGIRQALLIGAISILSVIQLKAQYSLRGYNFRPTGEFGFVMKPTFSADIGFSPVFDESNWRMRVAVTFLKMTPRMDTFPVVTVMTVGSSSTILPGKQSFSKYNIFMLSMGFDYAFYYNERFAIYGGTDLIGGAASVAYTEEVPTYKSEDYSGGGILAGFRLRIGADYYINDSWSVFADANRIGLLITEPAALTGASEYGIGIRYTLE